MLTIRLARAGVKKRPFFHIRVADSRKPRDGRFIEKVGYFNPIASGQEVRLEVDQERVDYWISQGAQLSDRVTTLLKRNAETPEQTEKRHALKEAKRLKKLSDKAALKVVEEAPAEEAAEAPAEEAPAEEAAEAPAERRSRRSSRSSSRGSSSRRSSRSSSRRKLQPKKQQKLQPRKLQPKKQQLQPKKQQKLQPRKLQPKKQQKLQPRKLQQKKQQKLQPRKLQPKKQKKIKLLLKNN